MTISSEQFKESMRCWASGVAIVTSIYDDVIHGMTVNSFHSISIFPPIIGVTLANDTRTKQMIDNTNVFGVTILSDEQQEISDRFAGRIIDSGNRFEGLQIFVLSSGVPFVKNGLAFFDCIVKYRYELAFSTLFMAEVIATENQPGKPLLYLNREYRYLRD
ncbi:MAG: hypothetical protein BGO78_04185 [Chloroflexi bacterium 44-23]|nr:MAG: hypothetical protein BGO78_04185 [Chloroflexi bacterium 44-23]